MSELQSEPSFVKKAPSELVPVEEYCYQIGAYVVSPADKTLTLDGKEVTIEPKVFDVLVYFCLNHERYIMTQELHDQVWQGSMVSDAAVRRAVSKLRILLGDDSKNPTFIKSGSKRGYKFICEVIKLSKFVDVPRPIASPVSLPQPASTKFGRKALVAIMIVVVMGLAAWWLSKLDTATGNVAIMHTEPMFDYLGEKHFIATTQNADKVAFSARIPGFSGFQIFLKRQGDHKVEQITKTANSVLKFDFSGDGQTLYYIDMLAGASSLNQISLHTTAAPPQPLVEHFYYISDVAVLKDGSGLFFNGLKSIDDSSQLYFYNFSDGQYQVINHKLNEDFHDNKVAVSADSQLLAFVTVMGKLGEQQVSVKNRLTQQIMTRFHHDKAIFQLSWYDNNSLIILDEVGVHSIDLATRAKTQLFENSKHKIRAIAMYADKKMLLLSEPAPANFFSQIDLANFNVESQHILSTDKRIQQMLYIDDEGSMLVYKIDDQANVISTQKGTTETVHLKTSASLEVYQVAKQGRLILAKLDNALALLDTQTNEISYITGGKQFLAEDAAFSSDYTQVFYGDKTPDDWVMNAYSIQDKSNSVLMSGFRSAREIPGGYLLADKSDQVHRYNIAEQKLTPLGIELSIDLNTRWFVRGNSLYWTKFDTKHTFFNIYDFVKNERKEYKLDATHNDPRFDIDKSGKRIVLKNHQPANTKILQALYR